jgi:hypothetical protein
LSYLITPSSFPSQIDVAAAFMGTVANIGQLVTSAQIPCGSTVSLIGETLGPMLFSCGPMAPALQLPVRLIIMINRELQSEQPHLFVAI